MTTAALAELLCKALCEEITLHEQPGGFYLIETPFEFSDGDGFVLSLRELPNGTLRLSDLGHTLMHLSYENDIDRFFDGTRERLFQQIISELGVEYGDGEFFVFAGRADVGEKLLRLCQTLTKITDLTFLNRLRVASTFWDDLKSMLNKVVTPPHVVENYQVPSIPSPELYPIDFKIDGKTLPLFLFGIPDDRKAKMTTMILEHLLRLNVQFESLLVFADQTSIPKADLARLSNVGGEQISSLDAYEEFKRKVSKRAMVNGQAY